MAEHGVLYAPFRPPTGETPAPGSSVAAASQEGPTASTVAPSMAETAPESLRVFRRMHQRGTDVNDEYAIATATQDMREARWNEIKDVGRFDSVNTPMAYGNKMVLLAEQQREAELASAAADLRHEYRFVEGATSSDISSLTGVPGVGNPKATNALLARAAQERAIDGGTGAPSSAGDPIQPPPIVQPARSLPLGGPRRWNARSLRPPDTAER